MDTMKIAIIGAGGVGGYFGAKLAQAGYDVTFVARGAHLKAMRNKGLHIKSIQGDFRLETVQATDNITDLDKPDIILIGVKSWYIKEIRKDISKILKKDSMIIPLQNGVFIADELSEKIDRSNILGGLCRIISEIESPGVIRHSGVTPILVFGELDNAKTDRVFRVQEIFDTAGIASEIAEDIEADLWKKFITICLSGLLVVSNSTYGELRELRGTRQLMVDLLTEIFLLSQKMGVNIEADFVDKTVAFVDTYPYDATSSLTRDVWDKKPSEIEYQNGTVVRLGRKYGIATPVNAFVYHCILPSELRARGKRYEAFIPNDETIFPLS